MFSHRQTTSSSSRCSALPHARQVVGITHGCESAGRRLRIGATTRGMTSPAFSMTTVSPSRMSLRAMSSALCSVAIEIVEPATNTGSSTAYGVFAPVRPTFTSIRSSFVCSCCAGNLNAVAHRGNFAVVPSRSRSARSSTLIDDAVGVELELVALLGPVVAERDDRVDALARAPVRLDRQAPRSHRAEHLGVTSACSGVAANHLVRERRQARFDDQRRIEIPHRPGGDVARVREERLAFVLALLVDALERGARQVDLAADLDGARPTSVRNDSGIARIVRTFAVTSSPRMPSPRVAPRTRRPSSYVSAMLRPSIFSSATYATAPSPRPAALAHALVERAQLLFVVGVVEAEHRREVLDGRKAVGRPAGDALRRRIWP